MDLKMEVYNPFLESLGVLEQYNSVIWEDKAFSAGSFSVDALMTKQTMKLLAPNNILWIEGDTAGIIEFLEEKADAGAYITVKGRLLTGILDFFILYGQYDLNGTAPNIMRQLVNDCAIAPTRWDAEARKVPNLVLADAVSGGQTVRTQKTGGSLLEALEELGSAYNVPFGVRFNPAIPQMEFWTRLSADRSVHQSTNDHVLYSTELDDVLSSEYSYNSTDWRNVAAVAGEGTGGDRVMITVESSTEPAPEPPEPTTYTITLSVDPEGGGLASGGGTVSGGQSVTVTAAPSSGYLFSGWRENGAIVSTEQSYTFTAAGNRSLTAVFEVSIPVYTITATIAPAGSGTVTGAGQYQEGETVTLVATPAEGYKFSGWQENGQTVSTDTTYSFTASANRTFVVAFAEKPASRLPEGYTELEYIESNGKQYFDIGFPTGTLFYAYKHYIKANLLSSGSIFGYQTQYSSSYYGYGVSYTTSTSKNTLSFLCSSGNSYQPSCLTVNIESGDNVEIMADFINNEFMVNGQSYPSATAPVNLTRHNTQYAFARHYELVSGSESAKNNIKMQLKVFQIYRPAGTLLRDYVPCINPSGVVGMYDLVQGKFYKSASTTAFVAGPTI